MIAYWALDESEGAIAMENLSGDHADVIGNPVWQPEVGVVDGALLLDGIDDYLQTSSILNHEDPFSVFLWVRGGTGGQVILSQEGLSNWLLLDAGTGALRTEIMAGGRGVTDHSLASTTLIADDAWHRVSLVWDGSERRLYVDGSVVATDIHKGGLEASMNGLNIGCGMNREPGSFWSGMVDDVRVYDRAVEP